MRYPLSVDVMRSRSFVTPCLHKVNQLKFMIFFFCCRRRRRCCCFSVALSCIYALC